VRCLKLVRLLVPSASEMFRLRGALRLLSQYHHRARYQHSTLSSMVHLTARADRPRFTRERSNYSSSSSSPSDPSRSSRVRLRLTCALPRGARRFTALPPAFLTRLPTSASQSSVTNLGSGRIPACVFVCHASPARGVVPARSCVRSMCTQWFMRRAHRNALQATRRHSCGVLGVFLRFLSWQNIAL